MLAAFVVPVSRLAEFAAVAAAPLESTDSPWPLSVLIGPEHSRELNELATWIRNMAPGKVGVTALEHRPANPEGIADFVAGVSGIETGAICCEPALPRPASSRGMRPPTLQRR